MGNKVVEMGRYGASEALRNKNLQKKAVNYGINKLTPFIQDSVGTAMDQLSTKVRPNIKYKTDRKDLDGRGILPLHPPIGRGIESILTSGVYGSPYQVDFKKGYELLTHPDLFKTPTKQETTNMKDRVKYYKAEYKKAKDAGYKGSYTSYAKKMGWVEKPSFVFPGFGRGILPLHPPIGRGLDIHKAIGKIPKPKAGWTPGNYKYMGPYNPLDKQLKYDPNTGEVLEWYVNPYNKVDEIAAHHDICYDMGKNKGDCDKEMVKSLDAIPYGEMPKWGSTARFLINTKQKLGLGIGGLHPPYDPPASKNVSRR